LVFDSHLGEGDIVERGVLDRLDDLFAADFAEHRNDDGVGQRFERVVALADLGQGSRAGHRVSSDLMVRRKVGLAARTVRAAAKASRIAVGQAVYLRSGTLKPMST